MGKKEDLSDFERGMVVGARRLVWVFLTILDIFLAHFGPLSTNWASFKLHRLPEYCCWPCPSLYDYSVPSSDDYFQQDNAPCHKAQIISDWFLEHDNEFTLLKWPPQSPDLVILNPQPEMLLSRWPSLYFLAIFLSIESKNLAVFFPDKYGKSKSPAILC